jgi:hypothetical protein
MQPTLRLLTLAILLATSLHVSGELLADSLAEKVALLAKQQQGTSTASQLPLKHTEAASLTPAAAAAAGEIHDYELHSIADKHKSSRSSYDKACPAGCEANGNCNRALGRYAKPHLVA